MNPAVIWPNALPTQLAIPFAAVDIELPTVLRTFFPALAIVVPTDKSPFLIPLAMDVIAPPNLPGRFLSAVVIGLITAPMSFLIFPAVFHTASGIDTRPFLIVDPI